MSESRNTSDLEPYEVDSNELSLLVAIPVFMYVISELSLFILITSYLSIKKLRTSEPGQMIIIISITIMVQQTFANTILFEKYFPPPLCFVTRFFHFYFTLVYLLVLAAESVNLLVKVGLVFASIDHFPLKASLIAFITPLLITGFIFSLVYNDIQTNSCQARLSDDFFVTVISVIGLFILFICAMFVLIGVMLCRHKCCSNSAQRDPDATRNLIWMIVTLFVLLGLSSILTSLLFFVEFSLQQQNTIQLFSIAQFTIVNSQGPALLIFQGVKLREVRSLWQRWITSALSQSWLAILTCFKNCRYRFN